MTDGCDISSEIARRWTSLDLSDKSTLVQVMAWCRQATRHCLNQCWPRSLSPYGVTRPQWVKLYKYDVMNITKHSDDIKWKHFPHYWPFVRYKYDVMNYNQTWWRHQMETFSALLALCAGNSLVTSELSSQRPVTWSFDVFFYLRLNKLLSKQPRCCDLRHHHVHYDVTVCLENDLTKHFLWAY